MIINRKLSLRTEVSLLALACALTGPVSIAGDKQAAQKTRVINGESYTFTKHVDEAGIVSTEVLNSKGRSVNPSTVPKVKANRVDPRVLAQLEELEREGRNQETIAVNIALNLPEEPADENPEDGEVEILNGLTVRGAVNGQEMSAKELNSYANERAHKQRTVQAQRNKARASRLESWAGRHSLANHKGLVNAASQGRRSATLKLTPGQLRALLRSNDQTIAGIELFEPAQDDISEAMDDTSITTSALPYSSTRGNNVGIFMTESGCPDEWRITNYDRLVGSESNHSRNVAAIIRAVSPSSYLYCRGDWTLPNSSELYGVGGNPPIHVISQSGSNNDTTAYNTYDREWDNFVYDNNVAMFNSGGNTGYGTGNVRSPGKGLNVISVGNYYDANDAISGSSPFVDPQTGNNKPEVVAPGTGITAGGLTMSGTSMSTPHAAAFTADMMSSSTYLKYKPYLAKAKLLAGATDTISGGYDKVGLGGIDFASAQWSGYASWYSGDNSAFSRFDANDGSSDGYIEKRIYISKSRERVRVALSWLNRGSYIYSHREDAHPIGMDLDLQVYDPKGNYIGGSYSWDNPFETVDFEPSRNGYYTFKIKRYANRDTSSALRMGLYVNYFNE